MADFSALIERMDEQRARWVSLPDGKRVRFRRPLEMEFVKFRIGVDVNHLCEYVCGWDGFSEVDRLGAAIGSSDPLPFSAELWSRVVRDRMDYVRPVATAMVEAITEHVAAKEASAKN